MSLTCPVCNADFPKSQRNCIPHSICDWNSFTHLIPPGTREEANMFCTECDSNFIATEESYEKLLKISYFAAILFIALPILAITALEYSKSYIPVPLILGGLVRVYVPQIMNASIIELEEAPMNHQF